MPKPKKKAKKTPSVKSKQNKNIKPADSSSSAQAPGSKTRLFDLLELVRRVLMTQDMLFLSRQVTYHISAQPDLPKVMADSEQVKLAFTNLFSRIVKRSPRGGSLSILLKEFTLRTGRGVRMSLSALDREMMDKDSSLILNALFDKKDADETGVSLAHCREIVQKQQGQMWAELQVANQPTYHIVLPISQGLPRISQQNHQTFKYDITIANYSLLRKSFGIKKSLYLVEQIEHYIRTLVRYPIDMVMAIPEKGIITTIYETQQGAAESVSSRISQRLGKEEFRIGRKPVSVVFHYNLSPFHPQNIAREVESHNLRRSG